MGVIKFSSPPPSNYGQVWGQNVGNFGSNKVNARGSPHTFSGKGREPPGRSLYLNRNFITPTHSETPDVAFCENAIHCDTAKDSVDGCPSTLEGW